ncbi:MAG: MGMT family protein, partial [Thermostichus sp. DG02_5_bins_236]
MPSLSKDILTLTASIPIGRVSTFRSFAEHIDGVPRHVAYILSTLLDEERDRIPWHRVVSESGQISAPNPAKAAAQAARLRAEQKGSLWKGNGKFLGSGNDWSRRQNWTVVCPAKSDLSPTRLNEAYDSVRSRQRDRVHL